MTFEQWLEQQDIFPISPEATLAQKAWEFAISMPKPVPKLDVILWSDPNLGDKEVFYVYQPGWKSPHFDTEEEAVQWATENGYVVKK